MDTIGTPKEVRDIPTIKAWRKWRHDAGLSSGFEDFYTVNGFCFQCKGSGIQFDYGYPNGTCEKCNGTGKKS